MYFQNKHKSQEITGFEINTLRILPVYMSSGSNVKASLVKIVFRMIDQGVNICLPEKKNH